MFKRLLSHSYIYRLYRYYFRGKRVEIKKFCESYYVGKTSDQKSRIRKDMRHWFLVRGISPSQYWEQRFDIISKANKKSMLPKSELFQFDRNIIHQLTFISLATSMNVTRDLRNTMGVSVSW